MLLKKQVLFLFIVLLSISGLSGQTRVLFRYSADLVSGAIEQNAYTASSVSFAEMVEPEETVARGTGGWGFIKRKVVSFNNSSSAIVTAANVQTSFFGDYDLSGELWINPVNASGVLLSWDDTSKLNGLNIFLENAKINLRMRLAGKDYNVVTPYGVILSEWQYINWSMSRKGTALDVSIYVNNKKAVQQKFTTTDAGSLVSLNTPVMVGKSLNAGIPVKNFNGYFHAANIKNYIPDVLYFTANLPIDGSSYFGLPNYHDYVPGGTDIPVDKRITVSPTPIKQASFIPYQNDGFMAQGITNTHEDEKYKGDEFIYISMYHKTATGQTGLKRSILVEVDPNNNYTVRRCFRLMGNLAYAHVGGIAFRNNSVYVSSASKIEVYTIPEFKSPNDVKYIDLGTSSANLFAVASKASFCTYFNDTLWIGDYRLSTEQNPYLFGYRLDAAGKVVTTETPAYYRLPYNTQGVAWKKYGSEKYLFISQSGGDAGSKVHRVKQSGLLPTALPAFDTTFKVPAGGEDLSFDKNGDMLNVSESGSLYMQKNTDPYTSFFPFIFTIDDSVLFVNKPTSVKEKNNTSGALTPSGFEMKAFPNPFNNTSSVFVNSAASGIATLKAYNSLGEQVETIYNGFINKGTSTIKWNADKHSSGTFFLVLAVDGVYRSTCKMVLLK